MPRRLRIRLITGLSCAIFGLLLAYVVSPIVIYFAAPTPIFDGRSLLGNPVDVTQFTSGMQQLNRFATVMTILGFGVTVVSALYSFVIFAIWFVGPPEPGNRAQNP